jgi:hypothetical protein
MIEAILDWIFHMISELWMLAGIMVAAWHSFMFSSMRKHGLTRSKKLTEKHIIEHQIGAILSMAAGFIASVVLVVHFMNEVSNGVGSDIPLSSMWEALENAAYVLAIATYIAVNRHLRMESDARLCREYFK